MQNQTKYGTCCIAVTCTHLAANLTTFSVCHRHLQNKKICHKIYSY